MSKFIRTSEEDFINLNNICHVWIQKCPNGWFLMGKFIHNSEEVVLSQCYEEKHSCYLHAIGLLNEKYGEGCK